MNAATRKSLTAIIEKAREALSTAFAEFASELRDLGEQEQEKFDNLSDGLQAGEGGQKLEEWANALSTAADAADDAQSALDSFEEALEELEGLM